MKVYVKESVALGRLSLGKGVHDLPQAIADELIKAKLAISKSSVIRVDQEYIKLEVAPDEKRTIIIKNVEHKDIGSTDIKRSYKHRGKGSSKGRSHGR